MHSENMAKILVNAHQSPKKSVSERKSGSSNQVGCEMQQTAERGWVIKVCNIMHDA